MKKLVISMALGVAAVTAFGQGQVVINTAALNAYAKYSNTVAGVWASGNAFYAGLYYSASSNALTDYNHGVLATAFSVSTPTAGTNGGLAIFTSAGGGGYVAATTFGANRLIGDSGSPEQGQVFVQLRAWSSTDPANGNPLLTYQQASDAMNPNVLITRPPGWPGVANPAPIVAVTPSSAGPPIGAAVQILWAPGSSSSAPLVVGLYPVPEPSTIALAGLGLLGLLFIRRRK